MKKILLKTVTILKDREQRKRLVHFLKESIINLPKNTLVFATFFVLLLIFMFKIFCQIVSHIPLIGRLLSRLIPSALQQKINRLLQFAVNKMEAVRNFKVKRYYLINLAYNNLRTKKTRSLITIFGMSVGVGIIVYLLSLGYGIERLVISRVARLDELKMTDVIPGETGDVKINEKLMKRIEKIEHVEAVLPVVSVVGKVNYHNAKTDILAYAVTDDYLRRIGAKLMRGAYYTDSGNYLSAKPGQVQGAKTVVISGDLGKRTSHNMVYFNAKPGVVLTAWDDCSIEAKVLGYTRRLEGGYIGEEYWGGTYAPYEPSGRVGYDKRTNTHLGKWIKARVPLYNRLPENGLQPILDDNGRQMWEDVCLEEKGMVIDPGLNLASVLGEATASAMVQETATAEASLEEATAEAALDSLEVTVMGSSSGGLELVSIDASTSAMASVGQKSEVAKFQHTPQKQALISSGMANFLNIPLKGVTSDKFKVSFIIMKSLIGNESGKIISQETEYEIVGVIDDDMSDYFYLPLSDMQKLGLRNYSQLKVVVDEKNRLSEVRHSIEELGVVTSSTADTVAQIEGLFVNIRLVLGLLGTIALGVAALGMFNTLTVSLLERTREIGGMKTMGMVSEEIQELFLSEAMIMGFAGGIGGLLLGFLVGEVSSFFVSLVAVANGVGYLRLNHVPLFLTLFIILSSFVVGVVTGLYPAKRAKHTSALNALRYE